LAGRERHVIGHNRLSEALESERAKLFGGDASLEGNVDALAEQDLGDAAGERSADERTGSRRCPKLRPSQPPPSHDDGNVE